MQDPINQGHGAQYLYHPRQLNPQLCKKILERLQGTNGMDGGSARGGQHDSLIAEQGRQLKAAVSARKRMLGRVHASFMAREQELHCLQVLTCLSPLI